VTLDEAHDHIGDGVVYRRPGSPVSQAEDGLIVRVGERFVFVCYGTPGSTPRATDPADLELLARPGA